VTMKMSPWRGRRFQCSGLTYRDVVLRLSTRPCNVVRVLSHKQQRNKASKINVRNKKTLESASDSQCPEGADKLSGSNITSGIKNETSHYN
jgi:hypothetical protein